MTTRRAILGLAAALLVSGCATTGLARGESAAAGCYDAANGRANAANGLAACNTAIADPALAPGLRAASLVNRGAIHLRSRELVEALADFDAAIAAAPANADAWLNKGIALIEAGGRDAEAVVVLTAALDYAPARPELVYFHRAGAYEALGRLRDAYDDYAEAAQLAPDWAEPANQLQRFKFVRRKTLTG